MNSAQRLVLLLLAISLLAGFMTGQPLYYRISYIWAILLVGSWLMSVLSLRGVVFVRSARTLRSQVGQIYEERFEIRNTSRWPHGWHPTHGVTGTTSVSPCGVMMLPGCCV